MARTTKTAGEPRNAAEAKERLAQLRARRVQLRERHRAGQDVDKPDYLDAGLDVEAWYEDRVPFHEAHEAKAAAERAAEEAKAMAPKLASELRAKLAALRRTFAAAVVAERDLVEAVDEFNGAVSTWRTRARSHRWLRGETDDIPHQPWATETFVGFDDVALGDVRLDDALKSVLFRALLGRDQGKWPLAERNLAPADLKAPDRRISRLVDTATPEDSDGN